MDRSVTAQQQRVRTTGSVERTSGECVLHTKVERIACWRGNDHDNREGPFDQVRPNRSAKRLGRGPEPRERKNTLPVPPPREDWSVGIEGRNLTNFIVGPCSISGESTYRPHSRSALEEPNSTAIKFPNDDKATRMLSPLTSEPKTFSKNRLAAICFAAAMSSLGTAGVGFASVRRL